MFLHVPCRHASEKTHILDISNTWSHTHAHAYIQSNPITVGGGGGGGGIGEPVILFDNGTVTPNLAHWVYVKGSNSGVLFPRNTFDGPTRISVFLRQIADLGISLVSRGQGRVTRTE